MKYPFEAYLVFQDHPRRTPEQNERARQRTLARIEETLAVIEGEPIEAEEFHHIMQTNCDPRGNMVVLDPGGLFR